MRMTPHHISGFLHRFTKFFFSEQVGTLRLIQYCFCRLYDPKAKKKATDQSIKNKQTFPNATLKIHTKIQITDTMFFPSINKEDLQSKNGDDNGEEVQVVIPGISSPPRDLILGKKRRLPIDLFDGRATSCLFRTMRCEASSSIDHHAAPIDKSDPRIDNQIPLMKIMATSSSSNNEDRIRLPSLPSQEVAMMGPPPMKRRRFQRRCSKTADMLRSSAATVAVLSEATTTTIDATLGEVRFGISSTGTSSRPFTARDNDVTFEAMELVQELLRRKNVIPSTY